MPQRNRPHSSRQPNRAGPNRADPSRPGPKRPPFRPSLPTDPARDAAIDRLAEAAERFPNLDPAAWTFSLPEARDAALAHAIVNAVTTRWLTLSYILDLRLSTPMDAIEPRLRAVLLAGAAQLLILDRIPAYAAIDHAVGWAKRRIRPGAGAMVNAVLRRLAALPNPDEPRRTDWTNQRDELPTSDGAAIALAAPIFPVGVIERLAIVTSHPQALLDAWRKNIGDRETIRVAHHGLANPPIILNTAHAKEDLPATLIAHQRPGAHVFTGSHAELVALLDSRWDIWVQDPASAMPVAGVRAALARTPVSAEPRLILDLCAGRGTKTRQLAATFPEAQIIATDVADHRRVILAKTFREHMRVQVLPTDHVAPKARGKADLILLDVPCSNTGVLPRRPEAKYRFGPKSIRDLVEIQKKILADAVPLLSPTGAILYSTCSLEPAENEEIVTWVAQSLGIYPLAAERHLPLGGPGKPDTQYTDASFWVLFTTQAPRLPAAITPAANAPIE